MATMENQSNTRSSTTKAAENELGDFKESAGTVASRVKNAVSEGAEAVTDKARAAYGTAAQSVKSAVEDPSKIAAALRDIVRDHPLAAIATVAVASLVIGRMLTRP
jgi:ElaB/YqjD/DUF883 family membrane-anchored ribosome-binding protein